MMAGFEIAVDLREPAWREITPDPVGYCTRIASEALEALGEAGGELSVVLAGDEFVRGLNRDYRGQDAATDVLSFGGEENDRPPADGGPRLFGHIVIAYGEASRGLPPGRARRPEYHLAHLLVHGILHLLGYDHEQDAEAEIMEGLEARLLERWGIPNPYAVAGTGPAAAGEMTK